MLHGRALRHFIRRADTYRRCTQGVMHALRSIGCSALRGDGYALV
ncbi:hypothetical protein K788_0007680 [Paraburkholderia caribensis MBA4]|uniref:Uncharacterized protein n=1 Tax=Paraburkholderia caribensis MBA4 TaxID=1323664 RepID=A0A0P0RG15_9BURK|nr:hypothetical protein K788_0007680 [Paraburkholderia caribensis MBA4]